MQLSLWFCFVGLLLLVIVCALFQRRPRPNAFSYDELNQIRIDRELAKESLLEEKAQRLKGRAQIHRHNRIVLTARKDAGHLLQGAQERWDARGRSIYGDAWDSPQDGNLPLRTLFNLPREEIDYIREEASRLLQAGPATSHPRRLIQQVDGVAHNGPDDGTRKKASDGSDEHRALTASARRGPACSRPFADAPFIDTRFVDVPTPANVPPLDFTWLNDPDSSQYLRANPRQTTAAAKGGRTSYSRAGKNEVPIYPVPPLRKKQTSFADPAVSTIFGSTTTGGRQEFARHRNLALQTYFQDSGLTHPNPPDIPVPEPKREKQSMEPRHESLSARLARLAAGGNSTRVAPIELV